MSGFYKVGMRIEPHPDVPGVYGTVTSVDEDEATFTVTWDDGDVDMGMNQTVSEMEDLRVAPDV